MGNKVEYRPKGGAYRHAIAPAAKSHRHSNNAASALLCFTCGVCFILSLICTFLATLVVLLDQTVVEASQQYAMTEEAFRLPKEVKPLEYDLHLSPKIQNGSFTGKVTILLDVTNTRKTIALHQKDLNITNANFATYRLEKDYEINITSIDKPSKYEIFVITTENEFPPGLYKLSLEFEGNLQNKIIGFYSSTYFNKYLNETRYIATTKFEPTYARQAFPCFDEPSFKAEFSIKVDHPIDRGYNALSNMNVVSMSNNILKRTTTVTFAKTVPMSTYLACFIVSDFIADTKMAKGLNGKKFPVSVYTSKVQAKGKSYLALETGVKVIEYYTNLFQIDYPLPKLDMAAIPDFVSGAMENWGLVTYREARLLYDDRNNSIVDARNVINVIAHELAHMWFGNLVTMCWWNDLWLNEGFATFMSYKCANDVYPNQGHMDDFVINNLHYVFVTDSKLSSHPIIHQVKSADEITSSFNEIAYKKGASVLRMLENFIGPDTFYGAISTYLNKYAYANAETADLFNILQDAVGKEQVDLFDTMDTWTRQEGYPVINTVKSGNRTYTLTQKRFLSDLDLKSDPSKSNYGYNWTVPITYITNKQDSPTLVWFDRNANEVVIETEENIKWIKFNADQVGYYRVNYSTEDWKSFIELLLYNHTRISVLNRANLLDDAFSLAEAGELDYDIAMELSSYLLEEHHHAPWTVANIKYRNIYDMLTSVSTSKLTAERFKIYARQLVSTLYKDTTWNVDESTENDAPLSHISRKARMVALQFACTFEQEDCMREAGQLLQDWLLHDKWLHPDIREAVYYYGLRFRSDRGDWGNMFERLKDETDPGEKNKLMTGLAGIKSAEILMEYITRAKDSEVIRTQDFLTCLILISKNPEGRSVVWDWVRENWPFLVNRYTLNDRYLGQLIPSITCSFATETKLEEMKAFFEKYPDAGAGANGRASALETVQKNIKWIARNQEKIYNWIIKNYQKLVYDGL